MTKDKLLRNFNLARAERDRGTRESLEAAFQFLDEIEELLRVEEFQPFYKEWSRLAYDRAYIFNLMGMIKKSADMFRQSGEYANQGGDLIRFSVGEFRYFLTLYIGSELTAEETYGQFLQLEKQLAEIQPDSSSDTEQLDRAHYNLLKRLSDVAFEFDRDAFLRWITAFEAHPIYDDSRSRSDANFAFIQLQTQARRALVLGNFDEAARVFSYYLKIPIEENEQLAVEPLIAQQRENIELIASEVTEEIVRDYRDFGRALLNSTFDGADELAKKAWKRGLSLEDKAGNRRFVTDIRRDMTSAS